MAASGKELQLIELKDMIRELNTMIRNLQGTIDTLNISLKEKEEAIRELQAQNDWFRKQMFGAKSEKRILQPDGQMTLFDEDEEEKIPEIIQPEYIEISYKKEKRPRPLSLRNFLLAEQHRHDVLDLLLPFLEIS